MNAAKGIVWNLNNWHAGAVQNHQADQLKRTELEKQAKATADKELYSTTVDSFTANFETLSKLDGTVVDKDARPGNVKSSTQSLMKTAEGFAMEVTSVPGGRPTTKPGWYVNPTPPSHASDRPRNKQIKEEFIINEKSNTITYSKYDITERMQLDSGVCYSPNGTPMSPSHSPKTLTVLVDTFTLDLEKGSLVR